MQLSFAISAASLVLFACCFVLLPLRRHAVRDHRGFAHWPILAATLSVLLAIGLYLIIGNPKATVPAEEDHPAWQQNLVSQNNPAKSENEIASVSSLVDGLSERLEREPNDAGGWLLLAKSYQHLGRMEDAGAAYQRAADLGQTDAEFAASLETTNANASSDSEIRGRVSLSDDVAGSISDSATVFIIAKAATGSPMPLAVIRKPASALPFEFVLNDSASMVEGMNLSAAGKVVVTAKISATGDAFQSTPDLEARSSPFDASDPDYLELEIAPIASTANQ